MSLASIRSAVSSASTETGEKTAVSKILGSAGYRKQPRVQTHRNGRNVVRSYLWRDTPFGHIVLVAGPSVEGAVHKVEPVTGDVDAEDVDCYVPAQGRTPAYVAWKRGRGPQARRNTERRDYEAQTAASVYGVRPMPGGYGSRPPGYPHASRRNPFDFQAFKAATEAEFAAGTPGRVSSYVEETARPLSEHDEGCPSASRAPVYGVLYDANGRKYRVLYRAVQTRLDGAGPLLPSNTPSFAESPGYPVEFQARSLSRPGEQAKIRKIAQTLDPDRLLLPHADPTFGAPVVWEGNGERGTRQGTYYVLGGNSRTIALMLAPEDRYRAYEAQAATLWPDVWPDEPAPEGYRTVIVRQAFPDDCPTMRDAKALNAACQMPFSRAQALAGATQRSMAGEEDPLGEALSLVRGLGIPQDRLAAALGSVDWRTIIDRTNVGDFREKHGSLVNMLREVMGAERYNTAIAGVPEIAAKTVNALLIGFLPRSIIEQGFGNDREERAMLAALPMLVSLATGVERGVVPASWALLPHIEDARAFANKFRGRPYGQIASAVQAAFRQQSLALFGGGGQKVESLLKGMDPLAMLLGMVFVRAERLRDPLYAIEDTLQPYVEEAFAVEDKYDTGKPSSQSGLFGSGVGAKPKLPAGLAVKTLGDLVADKVPAQSRAAWQSVVEVLVEQAKAAPAPERVVPEVTTPASVLDLAVKHALGPGDTTFKWPELVSDLEGVGTEKERAEHIATAVMEIADEPSATGGIRHPSVIETEVRGLFPAILTDRLPAPEPDLFGGPPVPAPAAAPALETTWQEIAGLQREGVPLRIVDRGEENVYIDMRGDRLVIKVPDPTTFDLSDPGAQFREPEPTIVEPSGHLSDEARAAKVIYDALYGDDYRARDSYKPGGKLAGGAKRKLTNLAKKAMPDDEKLLMYLDVIAMREDYDKPREILSRRESAASQWPEPMNRTVRPAYHAILRSIDAEHQQTPRSITSGEVTKLTHKRGGVPGSLMLGYFGELKDAGVISESAYDEVWNAVEADDGQTVNAHRPLGSFTDAPAPASAPAGPDLSPIPYAANMPPGLVQPAQIDPDTYYMLWEQSPSGGWVQERSYKGQYVLDALLDGLRTKAQTSRPMIVMAQGDVPEPVRAAAPAARTDDDADGFVARGWPMGWDGSTKHARRLLISRVTHPSDLNESRLEDAMMNVSPEGRQAIVNYLDGIAGEGAVTPALVTLAQRVAADFDAEDAEYEVPAAPVRESVSVPLKRDELRLTAKGAVLARATRNVYRSEGDQSSFDGWWLGMWPDLVDASRASIQSPSVRYYQGVATFAPFSPAWGGVSSAAYEHTIQVSSRGIEGMSDSTKAALVRTGLFTRDAAEGWTVEEAYADASLDAPEWDVGGMVRSVDYLLYKWEIRSAIPIDRWAARSGPAGTALDTFVRLPDVTRQGWLVYSAPDTRPELLDYKYVNEERRWGVNGGLSNLRDFLAPANATVYDAEPFTYRAVKWDDVSQDPKIAIRAMLRAIYPTQKIKLKVSGWTARRKDIHSSVTVEFTGRYSRAEGEDLLPATPAFACLALTAGSRSDGVTLYDVRVPLWLVSDVSAAFRENTTKHARYSGYEIQWLMDHLTDSGVQPSSMIFDVRDAQKRGLPVFLGGGVQGSVGDQRAVWSYVYRTPEGKFIHLEVGGSSVTMDALYGLHNDPNRVAIMRDAYHRLLPWVTEKLKMRLKEPEGVAKPAPTPPSGGGGLTPLQKRMAAAMGLKTNPRRNGARRARRNPTLSDRGKAAISRILTGQKGASEVEAATVIENLIPIAQEQADLSAAEFVKLVLSTLDTLLAMVREEREQEEVDRLLEEAAGGAAPPMPAPAPAPPDRRLPGEVNDRLVAVKLAKGLSNLGWDAVAKSDDFGRPAYVAVKVYGFDGFTAHNKVQIHRGTDDEDEFRVVVNGGSMTRFIPGTGTVLDGSVLDFVQFVTATYADDNLFPTSEAARYADLQARIGSAAPTPAPAPAPAPAPGLDSTQQITLVRVATEIMLKDASEQMEERIAMEARAGNPDYLPLAPWSVQVSTPANDSLTTLRQHEPYRESTNAALGDTTFTYALGALTDAGKLMQIPFDPATGEAANLASGVAQSYIDALNEAWHDGMEFREGYPDRGENPGADSGFGPGQARAALTTAWRYGWRAADARAVHAEPAPAPTVTVAQGVPGYEIEGRTRKSGAPYVVLIPTDRVPKDEWKRRIASAKRAGSQRGWKGAWGNKRGGYPFDTREQAEAWWYSYFGVPAPGKAPAPADDDATLAALGVFPIAAVVLASQVRANLRAAGWPLVESQRVSDDAARVRVDWHGFDGATGYDAPMISRAIPGSDVWVATLDDGQTLQRPIREQADVERAATDFAAFIDRNLRAKDRYPTSEEAREADLRARIGGAAPASSQTPAPTPAPAPAGPSAPTLVAGAVTSAVEAAQGTGRRVVATGATSTPAPAPADAKAAALADLFADL